MDEFYKKKWVHVEQYDKMIYTLRRGGSGKSLKSIFI